MIHPDDEITVKKTYIIFRKINDYKYMEKMTLVHSYFFSKKDIKEYMRNRACLRKKRENGF